MKRGFQFTPMPVTAWSCCRSIITSHTCRPSKWGPGPLQHHHSTPSTLRQALLMTSLTAEQACLNKYLTSNTFCCYTRNISPASLDKVIRSYYMKRKRQGSDTGESSALEPAFLLETAAAKSLMSQVTPADGSSFRCPMLITPHVQQPLQVEQVSMQVRASCSITWGRHDV